MKFYCQQNIFKVIKNYLFNRFIENLVNTSLPNKLLLLRKPDFSSDNLSSTMSTSFHSAGDCQDEEKDETSLGQEVRQNLINLKKLFT